LTNKKVKKRRRSPGLNCNRETAILLFALSIVFLHLADSAISLTETILDILNNEAKHKLKQVLYFARNSVDLITAIGFSLMAFQVSMRRLRALQVKEEETQERRPVATIDIQSILSRKSYLPD
jgi:hypothetical protein